VFAPGGASNLKALIMNLLLVTEEKSDHSTFPMRQNRKFRLVVSTQSISFHFDMLDIRVDIA
jgi:hypothetical protein